ncbi:MAG: PD-(D/E)XK nuclease family protein, partial [Pirellulaceae bacterium]
MGIASEFLSWDRPALAAATEWLLKQAAGTVDGVVDLSHLIVVLPSAYAQRRLLRRLTEACHAADQGLIPPLIQTVGALPEQLYETKLPFAPNLVQQLAWGQTLRERPADELRPLIPLPPEATDIAAWRDYGDTIRRVYRELASNGYTFQAVAKVADQLEGFAEHDRWDVLASLQERYLARLDALELWDKQTARIVALEHDECRCEKRLVLIGAVDLNLTMRKMLDQVAAAGGDITALIVAPPELADRFDGHGCLIAEKWTSAQIEHDWERIHLVDGPAEQAEQVAGCLAELAASQTSKQVVIGMPDEGLIGEVTRVMARHEVITRFGPGRPAAKSRPFQALEIVVQLATGGRYSSLAELWRHPDLFDALKLKEPGADSLDAFFNKMLPARVDTLKDWPEELGPAIDRLRALTKLCPDKPATLTAWAETLRSILLAIYGELSIEVESSDHRHLARPLQAINKAFAEWTEVPESLQGSFTATEAVDLLKRQLGRELISADVDPAAVEMVGWLDLPLDDAPCAIVTSVNEGILPSSTNSDLFLPNVLRERLGIDDNRSRLARDAYQMQVVRHTREIVHWIVPKRNAQGDPVSPSRLLMACPNEELPARVLKLFGPAAEPSNRAIEKRELTEEDHHQRIAIPEPKPRTKPFTRISPTAIKLYLTCPYRFYLRYVAGLREMEDGSSELH